jgi:threonine dehydratase
LNLDRKLGIRPIRLLKSDAFQPAGSFKIRGIGAACGQSCQESQTPLRLFLGRECWNAVAYAGRRFSIPVMAFGPEMHLHDGAIDRSALVISNAGHKPVGR